MDANCYGGVTGAESVRAAHCRQPGDRYRSWDPARRGRFEGRIAGMLLDPRCTQVRLVVNIAHVLDSWDVNPAPFMAVMHACIHTSVAGNLRSLLYALTSQCISLMQAVRAAGGSPGVDWIPVTVRLQAGTEHRPEAAGQGRTVRAAAASKACIKQCSSESFGLLGVT